MTVHPGNHMTVHPSKQHPLVPYPRSITSKEFNRLCQGETITIGVHEKASNRIVWVSINFNKDTMERVNNIPTPF